MMCVSNFYLLTGDATGNDQQGLPHDEKRRKMKEKLSQFLESERSPHDGLLFMKKTLQPIINKMIDCDALVAAFGDLNDSEITELLQRCQSRPDESINLLPCQLEESSGRSHEISGDTWEANIYESTTKLELATRLLLDIVITQNTETSFKRVFILSEEISNVMKMEDSSKTTNKKSKKVGDRRMGKLNSLCRIAHPQMRCLATIGKIDSLKKLCPVTNDGKPAQFFPFHQTALYVLGGYDRSGKANKRGRIPGNIFGAEMKETLAELEDISKEILQKIST